MISNISTRIATNLYKESIISEEDIELYAYGFFVLLSKLMFCVIAILFGAIFNIIPESILFYILFSLIRSYAGGIHAPSEWQCTSFTSISMLLSIASIKMLINYDAIVVAFSILAMASVLIALFSPLDTPEKPLTVNEKQHYKKKSILIVLLILFLATISVVSNQTTFLYSCAISLLLESILLTLGKVSTKETTES